MLGVAKAAAGQLTNGCMDIEVEQRIALPVRLNVIEFVISFSLSVFLCSTQTIAQKGTA